ncbi:NAD(P)/FAD-dependent oxidoreductase [Baekduia soli]|uniref:NAD(P)/FAD-dependent oxidoreductase n=1 Tax=Baekduia soli TaxID=496014 RepID=UPI00165298EC|nr:FAD-dependent oxidoreductase [Baekduia soli]
MAHQRIIVVGAGIVGSVVALRLAQRGAAVTLIEAATPGSGTSGSSFAWIDASHPGLESYLDINVDSHPAWRELGAELGDPSWLALTGTIMWEDEPAAQATLERHVGLLRDLGHPVQAVTPAQAALLEPDLVTDDAAGTLWHFPTEGYLQPVAALGDLLALGRDAGLTVREGTRVTGLLRDGEAVTGVELEGGQRLPADVVVSCVGRFTQELLAPAGIDVPMVDAEPADSPAVGLLVLTTPVPARLRGVVMGDGLMLRPDGAGRLLLHSDAIDARVREQLATAAPPTLSEELVALVRARLRGAGAAQVQSARLGLRALPADHRPVVGLARDGLYVVATHSGVTLAAVLGRLVAEELIDHRQSEVLARYAPARFQEAA